MASASIRIAVFLDGRGKRALHLEPGVAFMRLQDQQGQPAEQGPIVKERTILFQLVQPVHSSPRAKPHIGKPDCAAVSATAAHHIGAIDAAGLLITSLEHPIGGKASRKDGSSIRLSRSVQISI